MDVFFINKEERIVNLLLLALFSHFIYYYNYILGLDSLLKAVVFITALFSLILGYSITKRKKFYREAQVKMNYRLLYLIGFLMYNVSLVAHAFFYGKILNKVSSYGDFYFHTSSRGYITVFFDWMPLGLLLMLQSSVRRNKKKKILFTFILILIYALFYLFVLMRRRQLVFLAVGIVTIFSDNKFFRNKLLLFSLGTLFYTMLMVAGRVRGVYQFFGLAYTIQYIIENFSFKWIQIKSTEGQAASMILNDVISYVKVYGVNVKPLIGALSTYMPTSLFGFKYSAFPSWYTTTFHPEVFNAGYAGSFIAEWYLYFSFPAVILAYFTLGTLLKKFEQISSIHFSVILALFIYIILILPRLDLASLIIMSLFQIIPVMFIYLVSSKVLISDVKVKDKVSLLG